MSREQRRCQAFHCSCIALRTCESTHRRLQACLDGIERVHDKVDGEGRERSGYPDVHISVVGHLRPLGVGERIGIAAYRLTYKMWWRNGCVERKKTRMAEARWIPSPNLIRSPRRHPRSNETDRRGRHSSLRDTDSKTCLLAFLMTRLCLSETGNFPEPSQRPIVGGLQDISSRFYNKGLIPPVIP